jgi:hypothetical protein
MAASPRVSDSVPGRRRPPLRNDNRRPCARPRLFTGQPRRRAAAQPHRAGPTKASVTGSRCLRPRTPPFGPSQQRRSVRPHHCFCLEAAALRAAWSVSSARFPVLPGRRPATMTRPLSVSRRASHSGNGGRPGPTPRSGHSARAAFRGRVSFPGPASLPVRERSLSRRRRPPRRRRRGAASRARCRTRGRWCGWSPRSRRRASRRSRSSPPLASSPCSSRRR